MRSLDRILYNALALPAMVGGLRLASFCVPKVRNGFRKRKGLWERIQGTMAGITEDAAPRFWFHASSTGEFLQTLPLLSAIRSSWPGALIAFTYFSPSADRFVRSSPLIDLPSPLPPDTPGNARRMFSILEPDILVFSRYDVWPNLVWEACRRNRPVVLINATLGPLSGRMRSLWKGFHGRLFSDIELICAATQGDRERFLSIGVPAWKVEVSGDTKYDETYQRVTTLARDPMPLKSPLTGRRVLIGGSTWPLEEDFLLTASAAIRERFPNLFLLLVPHEPTPRRIRELLRRSSRSGLRPATYSSLKDGISLDDIEVLIIDEVGRLAGLYPLAEIAYVGGGHTREVHNVLEPASISLPVLMGPRHARTSDAAILIEAGGAAVIRDESELKEQLCHLLDDRQALHRMGETALECVKKNLHGTERTLAILRSTFPTLFLKT